MRRQLFVEMTTAQQIAWLEGIRERRLASVNAYKELQAAKAKARDARLQAKAEQELRMMDKELEALEKAINKVEARRAKLVVLKAIIEQEA